MRPAFSLLPQDSGLRMPSRGYVVWVLKCSTRVICSRPCARLGKTPVLRMRAPDVPVHVWPGHRVCSRRARPDPALTALTAGGGGKRKWCAAFRGPKYGHLQVPCMGFWQRDLWFPTSLPVLHWQRDARVCSDLRTEGVLPSLSIPMRPELSGFFIVGVTEGGEIYQPNLPPSPPLPTRPNSAWGVMCSGAGPFLHLQGRGLWGDPFSPLRASVQWGSCRRYPMKCLAVP